MYSVELRIYNRENSNVVKEVEKRVLKSLKRNCVH